MIDSNAAVVAEGTIEVEAPVELVWETLTELNRWPVWNRDVKKVTFVGPLAAGSEFKWKVTAGTITSRLTLVEQPSRIAWSGRLSPLGVEAVDSWQIEARSGGETLVRQRESWDGRMVRLLKGPSKSMLQRSINSGLRALKAECERRVASPEAASERTPLED